MNYPVRSTLLVAMACGVAGLSGCTDPTPPKWGTETQMFLPGSKTQVWAVAPAVNISGQRAVDPILQADIVYAQMQQVHGLTMLPVNRVVEVMAGMRIEKIESAEQATMVCELLGCDALVLPTITAYDPYDPPKVGASIQVFAKPAGFVRPRNFDVRELSRMAAPPPDVALPPPDANSLQAVGIFDAANGSVRDALLDYARGRHDPVGPMGPKEYLSSMDRYCGFVYSSLTVDLMKQLDARQPKKEVVPDETAMKSE